MKNGNKTSIIEKYGKANILIASICICFLIINSIIVDATALEQLSPNKPIAYLLNFLAGCEGKLGVIGSMSKTFVFHQGQWWRLFTHIYLHAGVLHMVFNIFALLFAGKVVEKKIGCIRYLLLFNLVAIVNAIIVCLIFPDSTSVGASAGIFGMIGIVCVLIWKKDEECKKLLKRGELIYLIVFTLLSLVLGLESFVTHLVAFVLGDVIGFIIKRNNE